VEMLNAKVGRACQGVYTIHAAIFYGPQNSQNGADGKRELAGLCFLFFPAVETVGKRFSTNPRPQPPR
jgi:hypothetical protein